MITKKRNNYTLSKEAQAIIDRIPKQYKSKYISDALAAKQKLDQEEAEKITTYIIKPIPIDCRTHTFVPYWGSQCIRCGFLK